VRPDTDDRFGAFLDLLEASLDEPGLSGDQLARRAYLSRFHFDRLVAAALGEPPGTFRRRILLERAAHRLATTADSVIDIALDSGYGSPEAFTRAFAKAYGCTPTDYRRRPGTGTGAGAPRLRDLPAPSGVHFHPPGSLRLPADRRSNSMDVLTRMYDHHVELIGAIVDRCERLDDDVLDTPIEISVEGIDASPTLRSVTDRLVSQLEMWVSALEGGTSMPHPDDTSPPAQRQRLATAAPRFRELVVEPILEGRGEETFVDAICEPPETFTLGGVAAHVLTFSAVRRTLAIGALETAGIDDLGAGDPMLFVGGTGDDASRITRT